MNTNRLPKAKKTEFYELHRAEIELQEAARAAFDQLPEGTKLPTVKKTECRADQADPRAAGRICGVSEGQDGPYGIHPGKAECGCDLTSPTGRAGREIARIIMWYKLIFI